MLGGSFLGVAEPVRVVVERAAAPPVGGSGQWGGSQLGPVEAGGCRERSCTSIGPTSSPAPGMFISGVPAVPVGVKWDLTVI